MKIFYLISLIFIYISKCEYRTEKIKGKSCTTISSDMKTCPTLILNKALCEQKGCCFIEGNFFFEIFTRKCFYPSCIDGCEKCDDLKTCIQCQNNYYITEDTKKCYNTIINNYYLDGNILRRCHSNCLSCVSPKNNNIQNKIYDSISIYMNCTLCKENFYKLNGTNNCYDESFKKEGFYLKDNIFYPCDENCLTCSDKKNLKSNNCLTCNNNEKLYLVEDLNNCENYYSGYYLDNNIKILKKCYLSCKECKGPFESNNIKSKENHNCIECHDNYYKLGENNCFNKEIPIEGYYLDRDENIYIWKECYERCQTCNSSGNFTNMNCLSCKNDLVDSRTSKPYNFVLTRKGDCVEQCQNNLYLTLDGDCVINCPNGSYHFSFNHTCLESCPYNYEINIEQNKCIIKFFVQTTSSYEFKSQIIENIASYMNTSSLINGSDFLAIFLNTDNMEPKEQIKKGISAIDLGECTQIIKEYYNISNNESLIILNMESKNIENNQEKKDKDNSFNLGKNVQIEVYDKSGRKLNLSVCDKDITLMKFIGDIKELDIESAMSLAQKGIDVFNPYDDYFNDICQVYENSDGKDIIINDRRKDKFQNATFCQEGCSYGGINYELETAICKCDSSFMQNNLENNIVSTNNNKKEKLNFKT